VNSTAKKTKGESQVYKAKFTNSAGEKIKFLVRLKSYQLLNFRWAAILLLSLLFCLKKVRIMIFQMSDTFLAVSIEKED